MSVTRSKSSSSFLGGVVILFGVVLFLLQGSILMAGPSFIELSILIIVSGDTL